MSKNLIYCYSGSGNCLDIAKNIAKVLGDTDIVMMRSFPAVTDARNAERVGFVFPCYAGGLPGNVEQYVKTVTMGPDTYRFGVVSYSGYPGVGLKKISDIVRLDYWTGISHHCSCIWLFPHRLMVPTLSVKGAQKRSEKLAKKAAEEIAAKKKLDGEPGAFFLNALEAKAWPALSKKKAEKLTSDEQCISCGLCEKLCPAGNIRIVDGRPQFGKNCIGCLSCLQYCPAKAINMGGVTLKRERYHNPNTPAPELMKKVIHID
ncbi:MAG: EFR1 family ferrodoxin [Oscillospiraceae bacterium]|nr:EFR1 family ferrodoxin [Oscillospiraceae bacterium]